MMQYFPKVSATHRTFSASVNTDGVWAPGTVTDTPILIITPQPAVGATYDYNPEGQRKREYLYTWTESAVEIRNEIERQDPDQIIYDGETYLVNTTENWRSGLFREILMYRLLEAV